MSLEYDKLPHDKNVAPEKLQEARELLKDLEKLKNDAVQKSNRLQKFANLIQHRDWVDNLRKGSYINMDDVCEVLTVQDQVAMFGELKPIIVQHLDRVILRTAEENRNA